MLTPEVVIKTLFPMELIQEILVPIRYMGRGANVRVASERSSNPGIPLLWIWTVKQNIHGELPQVRFLHYKSMCPVSGRYIMTTCPHYIVRGLASPYCGIGMNTQNRYSRTFDVQ